MKKMKLFAGILLVGVMMSSAAMFAFAEDNGLTTSADNSLTTASQSDKLETSGSTRQLWIFVGNDGKFHARVRGAEAVAKSGNELTARLQWGAVTMDWKLMTDNSTEFIRRNGSASSMNEVSMGDVLSFTGIIDTSSQTRTLHSITVVKDWSLQESATFSGTVKSVNESEKSFVLHRGGIQNFWSNPSMKVVLTASTDIKMDNGKIATFADIKVGGNVKVQGVLNANHSAITAEHVSIMRPAVAMPMSAKVKHMFDGGLKLFGKLGGSDENHPTLQTSADASLKTSVESEKGTSLKNSSNTEASANVQVKVAGIMSIGKK